ncbi:MAG: hypothetical protein ACD_79C00672G0003 [uncultured bacterium]|nr:MAG: hypothetical protein ACD_79C00672G0003 [uncultured bacterium]
MDFKPNFFKITVIIKNLILVLFLIYSCANFADINKSELINLSDLDSDFKIDLRYATENNFTKMILYKNAVPLIQKPAGLALLKVNKELKKKGFVLIIYDAYRPLYVTKQLWDIVKDTNMRFFLANPAKGSVHNRGCSVDVSLFDLKNNCVVTMPSGYDDMTYRSKTSYKSKTSRENEMRDLLINEMLKQGFLSCSLEWWHFDYKDWERYPILNLDFSEIK